jgi:predicted component of type VI protein secretion system
MVNNSNEHNPLDTVTASPTKDVNDNATTWQLNALTEALGDLSLTVSNSDSLSVGRGSDNDVVLGSKQISRNHALLSVLNGMLYIKDLQSSNGTFVNSVRIESNQSQPLKADDTVGFASFSFQVLAAQAAMTVTKPPVVDAEPALTIDATTAVIDTDTEVADSERSAAAAIEDSVAAAVTTSHEPTDTQITNVITEPEPAVSTIDHTYHKPLQQDKPPMEDKKLSHEPMVAAVDTSTEHDKTTKTALQEQADPDILRAKQAATGQLSGTANLGQPRDLGTEGNNAMDQAIDNPANDGLVEKKPSGGWFVWVFIAIIIIGLALWLFNMGS